jgi:drug/metabolite transporter (DMT)-like permease
MSQFLGFFVWYKGLALGGVARVSQLQLLQPFLTVLASALLLGEIITATMLIFALAVVATVAIGRRMAIRRSTVEQ